MNLNPLPPAMREKKRYIVIKILSNAKIEYNELSYTLWNEFTRFLGEFELSISRAWLIEDLFDQENQIAVLRVNHNFVENFRAALALIKEISGKKVAIKVLGVTGTIKSAKERFLT
jgi:RNase P/RNase MRP subunit POP5